MPGPSQQEASFMQLPKKVCARCEDFFSERLGGTIRLYNCPALKMAAWIACVASPFALSADSVTLHPVADTGLSEQFPASNSGHAPEIVIGTQGPRAGTAKNRGLMKFDLTGKIPPHS